MPPEESPVMARLYASRRMLYLARERVFQFLINPRPLGDVAGLAKNRNHHRKLFFVDQIVENVEKRPSGDTRFQIRFWTVGRNVSVTAERLSLNRVFEFVPGSHSQFSDRVPHVALRDLLHDGSGRLIDQQHWARRSLDGPYGVRPMTYHRGSLLNSVFTQSGDEGFAQFV